MYGRLFPAVYTRYWINLHMISFKWSEWTGQWETKIPGMLDVVLLLCSDTRHDVNLHLMKYIYHYQWTAVALNKAWAECLSWTSYEDRDGGGGGCDIRTIGPPPPSLHITLWSILDGKQGDRKNWNVPNFIFIFYIDTFKKKLKICPHLWDAMINLKP